MLEVEILGADSPSAEHRSPAPERSLPPQDEIRRLCDLAAGSADVCDGHVAIEFVDAARIAELNAEHRGKPEPTDVLSFPVDGTGPAGGARELGDVVICPTHTADVREAILHGMLHLLGMDHEADDGEMLALQRQLLGRVTH